MGPTNTSSPTDPAPRAARRGGIQAEHEKISHLVSELVAATRASTAGWNAATRARAVVPIGNLQRVLPKHFAREEKSGYVTEAVELEPHLDRIARNLLAEHDELCAGLHELAVLVRAVRTDEEVWAFRAEARAWVRALRRHEMEENRLIHWAHTQDLGGGG